MEKKKKKVHFIPDKAIEKQYHTYNNKQILYVPRDITHYWFPRRNDTPLHIIEQVNVDTIARSGDIYSVEHYMKLINFTNPPKMFGTQSSTNAFLILQLGAEYLQALKCNFFKPLHSPLQKVMDQSIIDQNNIMMDEYQRVLSMQTDIINQLNMQNNRLAKEIRGLHKVKHRIKGRIRRRLRSVV